MTFPHNKRQNVEDVISQVAMGHVRDTYRDSELLVLN